MHLSIFLSNYSLTLLVKYLDEHIFFHISSYIPFMTNLFILAILMYTWYKRMAYVTIIEFPNVLS